MTISKNKSNNFTKSMFSLAVPIALQNLMTSSFTLVDTLMVSQLGDISLASVGMAGQWSWLLNIAIFGICSGSSVFFSQYYGDNDEKGFVKSYGLSLVAGTILVLLFSLSAFLFPRGIVGIFNRTPEVLEEGSKYLKIALFSYPAILLNQLSCTVLRSRKKVKLPMYTALFTTIMNAFLDYALIFGAFGLPELGIKGAAIATVVSAWSGPVIIYIVRAIKKDKILFARLSDLFVISPKFASQFFKKIIPVVVNEGLWGLGTMVYNIIYSNMGYEYSAAVTILKTIENIAFSFFVGFNNAGSILVGQFVGSGEIKKAISYAKKFVIIVPVAGVIIGSVILLLRDNLINIFNFGGNISSTTLKAARGVVLIYAIAIGIKNISYVTIAGIFRAGGETKRAMKYDIFGLWVLSIPATFIAAFVLKLPFVAVFAVSHIFEDYLKCFLCIKLFISMAWIKPVTENGRIALNEYMANRTIRQ